jgi:hypothetical protein
MNLQACRSRVLDIVDNLLVGSQEEGLELPAAESVPATIAAVDMVSLVLGPWLEQLLVALKTVVTAVWEGGAKQMQRVRKCGLCVNLCTYKLQADAEGERVWLVCQPMHIQTSSRCRR